VARLLHSGLFHSVRDDPATLAKVTVLEGDLTDEGICLEPDVIEELVASCNFVVHAASIIELEADVQRSLRGNYLGWVI
jgi:thioester reductase-like protein